MLLDEYAIRVYSLVIEANKAKAVEQLLRFEVALLPNQDEKVYDEIVERYQRQAGLVEEVEDDPNAMEKLKKILMGG